MNAKKIIKHYLKSNGFDGLCNPEIPCGCLLEDLAPCGEDFSDCQPGYRVPCDGSCDYGKDERCPWHVSIHRPDKNAFIHKRLSEREVTA